MTKQEKKQELVALLDKINPDSAKEDVAAVLSQLILKVGAIKYTLEDIPLVSGALNLLVSTVALDYEEKEKNNYEHDTALKTIVDLARF